MRSKWWYASDSFEEGFTKVKSTTASGSQDKNFLNAQKLTITVDEAWMRDAKDGWGKKSNDLIITTKHLVGNKQAVDKVHFYKPNFPARQYVGATFHPVVYATNDFNPDAQEITLQVRAYDEDGLSDNEKKGIQSAMSAATSASAIAFPAFAPIAGLTAGVGSALVNLIDSLNDHDPLIDSTIRLSINKPEGKGYDLLQPGFLICLSEDIDASGLLLGEDRKLYVKTASSVDQYTGVSYVIIRIDRTFLQQPDYIIDEKAATLLSEIESGKQDKANDALYFVRDTLTAYNNFRRLQRYKELKDKGTSLTKDESDLLEEIRKDPALSPFLPK